MGNSQSSPSIHSPTSIRSARSSRKLRSSIDSKPPNRVSQAVSFYQTPPGSFDPERPLSYIPSSERPESSATESLAEQLTSTAAALEVPQQHGDSEPPKCAKWKPGIYSLVNAQSGTVMDLSGADNQSVIGFPLHKGTNQQWRFEPSGEGFIIRSVSSGKYLVVEEGMSDGTPLATSAFPMSWKVDVVREEEQVAIRILWPSGKYACDLADFGSTTPGTKVQLAPSRPDERCQEWLLIEHAPSLSEPSSPVTPPEKADVVSSPPLETVFVAEDKDCITTTRTTTTSTITTVTTVIRTPKGE